MANKDDKKGIYWFLTGCFHFLVENITHKHKKTFVYSWSENITHKHKKTFVYSWSNQPIYPL